MSRARRISTIAKKELVEFVRDWRTIVAILVIPLLMFPLLFILFPLLLESEAAELDAMVVDVVVQTDGIPFELETTFNNSTLNITYEPLPLLNQLSQPGDDAERLRNGTVDVVLRMQTNGTVLEYALLYMSTSEQSLEARARTFDVLAGWEANETVRRISDAGLDPDLTLDPLRWDGDVGQSDVATQGEQAGMGEGPQKGRFLAHATRESLGVSAQCFLHSEVASKIQRPFPCECIVDPLHSCVVADVFPCC